MKVKFYLAILGLFLTIGAISFSFKSANTKVCTMKQLSNPSGAALNQGAGYTGASWDNSGAYCNSCHGGGSYGPKTFLRLLDSATGNQVTEYLPNVAYKLEVKDTCTSGTPRYAFCIMAAKSTLHTNINTWGTMPSGVANHTVNSRNYIEQSASARTATSTTPTSRYILNLPWRGPAAGSGSVTFYAEVMATNGSTTNGDSPATPVNLTVTEGIVTPVVISSIIAQKDVKGAQVKWNTASETNISKYLVQHSLDGISFETIGTVDANNDSKENQYSFIHTNPSNGTNYYRIIISDIGGSSTFSKVVNVTYNKGKEFTVTPNPVNNTIQVGNFIGSTYGIYNSIGRKVATGKIESTQLNLSNLSSGTYTITIEKDGRKSTASFIKL